MKRISVTACLVSSFLSQSSLGLAQPTSSLVGLRYQTISEPGQAPVYKNLPAGLEIQGGWIVGDVSIEQPYVIAIYQQASRQMLGFERILSNQTANRPQGLANWQTIEVLDVVEILKDLYTLTSCDRNRIRDPEIFALVKPSREHEQLEWIAQFHQVWKADRKTQKLKIISSNGIRCLNPG